MELTQPEEEGAGGRGDLHYGSRDRVTAIVGLGRENAEVFPITTCFIPYVGYTSGDVYSIVSRHEPHSAKAGCATDEAGVVLAY